MLDRLLRIEEQFARAEALLLVIFVLLMLALATYNVFYGNVLVPIQVSVLTSDEARAEVPEQTAPTKPEPTVPTEEPATDEAGGFGGGFGGGFDAPEVPAVDDGAGFGGDFGDARPTEVPDEEPAAKPADPPGDAAGGFGGGFGGDFDAPDDEPTDSAGGLGGGFGGDFDEAGTAEPDEASPVADTATSPDVPKEVPFIARAIDAVKLEWIDVLLRQLVLIVGFLGAMLATRRRKHITIDALSKLLPKSWLHWVAVVTNTISIVVCVLLAKAGADLVAISLEYPKELTTWADEWEFQLAFPVGFGLLVFHFTIRLIESLYYATGKAEPPAGFEHAGGAA